VPGAVGEVGVVDLVGMVGVVGSVVTVVPPPHPAAIVASRATATSNAMKAMVLGFFSTAPPRLLVSRTYSPGRGVFLH